MQEHNYKFWRDLIRPKSFEIEKESLTADYGKFTVKPLERGYGVTIGNSLRRIMLSSMMGSAVTAAKFEGVLHEFTTIPDVLEDVQKHLEHCEICSAILDSTRNILILTADDRVFELPLGYSDRLHARLEEEIKGIEPPPTKDD